MSQGNSLYSYPKQTKMSSFFFYKIGEQEGRRNRSSLVGGGGVRKEGGVGTSDGEMQEKCVEG
jgi:hypothetical protein